MRPPTRGFAGNSIGDGFDASAKYVFHDHWAMNAGVEHFFSGNLMLADVHNALLSYLFCGITYRFSVNK